jgi:SpoVK/Ycf46/Vps4 family AAA+-type ATPase
MARADLLVNLVQSGLKGDKPRFKKVVEAIIAEERAKQHKVLADKLEETLQNAPMERPAVNGNGTMIADPRIGALVQEIVPRKKLENLILPEEVLKICHNIISEQHRSDLLRSYNLEPRHRLLFIGPAGNGKTSLAEAIAEELMVPLLVVRYEMIIGAYLGETAGRLRKLFDYAATRQCVLFFDEFETLGKERGDTHETGEIKRVVSSLLLQIDDMPSHVVVIGATNHPELLDRAVWRRFQVRINLPHPTLETLVAWFKKFENRIALSLGHPHHKLAKQLLGLSFAEVEEFGITVYRQYVLSQPNSQLNIKNIVSQILEQWSTGTVKVQQQENLEVKSA